MSTYNHTPVATGAAANAAVVNSPIGQLDGAIGQLSALTTTVKTSTVAAINEIRSQAITGGSAVTDAQLKDWTEAGAYEATAVTYDATYTNTITSATIKWPDGSSGVFTATTINGAYESVDAYTVTHASSNKTVTQAAVTRNSAGNITGKPALTVA